MPLHAPIVNSLQGFPAKFYRAFFPHYGKGTLEILVISEDVDFHLADTSVFEKDCPCSIVLNFNFWVAQMACKPHNLFCLANEPLHNVNVVYALVKHCSAGNFLNPVPFVLKVFRRAKPPDNKVASEHFAKHAAIDSILEGINTRVVAHLVDNKNLAAAFERDCAEPVNGFKGNPHRFFREHILACIEGIDCKVCMCRNGGANADKRDVTSREQFIVVCIKRDTLLS